MVRGRCRHMICARVTTQRLTSLAARLGILKDRRRIRDRRVDDPVTVRLRMAVCTTASCLLRGFVTNYIGAYCFYQKGAVDRLNSRLNAEDKGHFVL